MLLMLMVIIVTVLMLMVMLMFMLMFVLMMMIVFQLDVEGAGVDAVGIGTGDGDGIPGDVQAVERGEKLDFRCAEVKKRGHGHVAADSGGAFEVEDLFVHGRFPRIARVLMRAAR